VTRRFDPAETLHFPEGSFSPTIDENVQRSLDLFIEVLSSLESVDSRISTNPGRVEFADTYKGQPVTWILSVVNSIYMAISGDTHVSIRAIAYTKSGTPYTSRVACVFSGKIPVGDYLANVVLMFHNDKLVDTINTLEQVRKEVFRSVRRAEKSEAAEAEYEAHRQQMLEIARRRNERRAAETAERQEREAKLIEDGIDALFDDDGHVWPNFYANVIAVDVSTRVRARLIRELDSVNRDELSDTIDRLYEIDCNSEPCFPAYERDWLLRSLISEPISPSARIGMIHRLDDRDNDALQRLDRLRDELVAGIENHEDSDGLLLSAVLDAIDRIRGKHYERMFASARRSRR